MKMKQVALKNITKIYKKKNQKIEVLKDINVQFETGKLYAIMGPSGSGKSTFFNILGLIDTYDSGKYELLGKDITAYKDKDLSEIRMNNIGFIFQDFHLDEYLTAIENVLMPMFINKKIMKNERVEIATNLLKKMGLEDRLNHFPKELSGGEQQRVAIARALVNNPNIILADEPTGNLDEEKQDEIFKLLKKLSQDRCVIVVSHNKEIKNYADVIYNLKDGKLIEVNHENK